ncbi:hypothetical protein Tco_1436974 [Tanacetum coccineum]
MSHPFSTPHFYPTPLNSISTLAIPYNPIRQGMKTKKQWLRLMDLESKKMKGCDDLETSLTQETHPLVHSQKKHKEKP